MNGIENITDSIRKESEQKAEQILAQAQADKQQILDKLVSDARAEGEDAVYMAQKHAFELVNRAKSMSGLESRKKLLAAKREIIDEVFDRIEMNFNTMAPADYVKLLARMAVSAGGGEITFSDADKQYAQGVYSMLDSKKFSLSGSYTDSITGGFIIRNGAVQTECSVRSAIEEKRRELEPEIAKILFDEDR